MITEFFKSLLEAHPVVFQWGGFTLYAHALFFIIGAEVALLVLTKLAKRQSLDTSRLPVRVLAIFVAGLVAARIGYFISYPSQFESIVQVLKIWEGGLVSYFGIIGGLLMGAWLTRGMQAEERWRWFDLLVIASLVGWAIGRVGNYYAADSVGVVNAQWELFYNRVPIQLIESLLTLGLARVGFQNLQRFQPGKLALMLMTGYLVGRFVIDFWRDEPYLGPFHFSQVISLVVVPFLIPHIVKNDEPLA